MRKLLGDPLALTFGKPFGVQEIDVCALNGWMIGGTLFALTHSKPPMTFNEILDLLLSSPNIERAEPAPPGGVGAAWGDDAGRPPEVPQLEQLIGRFHGPVLGDESREMHILATNQVGSDVCWLRVSSYMGEDVVEISMRVLRTLPLLDREEQYLMLRDCYQHLKWFRDRMREVMRHNCELELASGRMRKRVSKGVVWVQRLSEEGKVMAETAFGSPAAAEAARRKKRKGPEAQSHDGNGGRREVVINRDWQPFL